MCCREEYDFSVYIVENGSESDYAKMGDVADVKWMIGQEIKRLYDNVDFVETLDYFFCAVGTVIPVIPGSLCVWNRSAFADRYR